MDSISTYTGLSVVICCYNSGWIIGRTLEALKQQKVRENLHWEIILVDNCCTDDTVQVARRTMAGCGIDFVIVEESEPGLANARRKGVMTAKYGITVFCDDDNLLCDNYIDTMYNIMQSNARIGAAGGKGIPEFQVEPADIVKENIACYATGSQIDHDVWLYGAGLVLRTNLLCDIYEKQHCYLVGRKGNQLLSGEDSEIVMSMVMRGYKIFATDDVTFVHVLKAERLTEAYFYRLQEGLVLPAPVFETFRAVIDGRSFNVVLQKYYKSVKSILWSYLFFYKANSKEVRQWSKDCLKRYHFWGISTLWRIYKEWNDIKQSSQNVLSA